LYCFSNQLTSLDVSRLTSLKILACAGNPLTSLDVSGLTKLEELQCTESLNVIGAGDGVRFVYFDEDGNIIN
jgi:Leucine-rich repeat (LRR) protein